MAFLLYGTYGFAQYFHHVSLNYGHHCLRKYKMAISRKTGDAKKIYVTFFSKNVRFHTFRQEKSIESTFFTHKIAFYFSEIFNFLEMDLLRKKGWSGYFCSKMKENGVFIKKIPKKKFLHPPCFQEISILYFLRQSWPKLMKRFQNSEKILIPQVIYNHSL